MNHVIHVAAIVHIGHDYEDGAKDDIDCTVDDTDLSYLKWTDQRPETGRGLAGCADLGTLSKVSGRSIRWNLAKFVGECARHNGHADIIRDGSTVGLASDAAGKTLRARRQIHALVRDSRRLSVGCACGSRGDPLGQGL